VKQEIGRTVASVEVRRRIVILIEAEVVAVETKIDVETTIVVIVGDGGVREGTLRRGCKFERVALQFKFAVALVEEKQWA